MRILRVLFACLIALIACSSLFACDFETLGVKNTYELYLDYNTNETDTYTFAIECGEWGHTNIDVDFDIVIKNTTIKPLTFKFHNAKLVRESTGAVYSVGSFFGRGFEKKTLESDLTEEEEFSSTIPTSYKTENYRFEISLNKDKYIFYLYEKPDELREKYTVSYSINGEIVRTKEVPEDRTLPLSGYTDLTNLIKCNEWFFDSELRNEASTSFKIKEDITVYGKLMDMLDATVENGFGSTSKIAHIKKVNFVPLSGEIIIPKIYKGAKVTSTGLYPFGAPSEPLKELKILYIPKGVTIYAYFDFCPNLKTIYYEGTEAEWNSACWNDPPSSVKIIFNTYKESE